jgi:hypothetical protein
MKRWILVSSVVLISALGVSVPAGAQASTAAGGELTSGKPVTVTISKVGQEFKYTFAATANKNVTFEITKFKLTDDGSTGAAYLYFYEPGSSTAYTDSYFDANGYFNFTPPQSGTWSVALVPYGASVGSLTLTFANDVATQALKSGTPVSTTIKYEGQEAGYTFAATANKNVTFDVTKFHFTDNGSAGAFYLYFYEPGSSTADTDSYFDANGYYNFTPPQTGTWSVALIPYGASVGSLTLTFANDVPTQALKSGTPVSTTIKYEGQEAGYTFAATANKNVTFDVTNFDFTDNGSAGAFYLYFYEPGSSTADTDSYFDANGYYNFTPPQTGTWSVALIPYGASVGSLTLTFANDVPTQALKSGTPVSTTIKYEGQESGYTFAATANKSVTLHVTKFDFTDNGSAGAFYLYFYEPGSSSYYTDCYFDANGTCTVKAPVGGTWSIALVPYGASVGSLTIKLT